MLFCWCWAVNKVGDAPMAVPIVMLFASLAFCPSIAEYILKGTVGFDPICRVASFQLEIPAVLVRPS